MPRVPTGKYGNYSFNDVILAVKMEFPQNDFSFDLEELRILSQWHELFVDIGFELILPEGTDELIAKIERIIKKIKNQIKEAIS